MTVLIALLLMPLSILTLCFVVEVFAGLRPLAVMDIPAAPRARAVIIVPAHDEEAILHDRLTALKAAGGHEAKILVIADNCSDLTAAIARRLGVDVLERHDPLLRGKGFALDFGRQSLQRSPPDIVLIVDADCSMDRASIVQLIAVCAATGRPCQARNVQQPSPLSSRAVQLSTFAFFVKNVIRQRGLQRLAGHGQLLGTGMAFPWAVFQTVDIATDEIVEDLKLSLELSRQGHGVMFVERASVSSAAETDQNTLSQRSRWEGGFLRNAVRAGPSLLMRSVGRADWRSAWAAINLLIPPLALLVTVDVIALMLAGALTWWWGASSWPALLLLALLILAAVAIVLAWRAGGSQFVTLGALAQIPLYMLWKIPLYLRFVRSGAPSEWVRTSRAELVREQSGGDLPHP